MSTAIVKSEVRGSGGVSAAATKRILLGHWKSRVGHWIFHSSCRPAALPSRRLALLSAVLAFATGLLAAGVKINPGNMSPYSKTNVGAQLYTDPDPSASGGIRGKLDDLPSDLLGVIAVPQKFSDISSRDEGAEGTAAKNARSTTKEVQIPAYLASIGSDSFSFRGLPPGKYDLLVVCDNAMYDGILLAREISTLTDADVTSIKDIVDKSNPFFNMKNVQRLEGVPGGYGKARSLGQDMRTLPITLQSAEVLSHIQIRAVKIYQFEQIASSKMGKPMWAIKRTRELVRQEIGPPDTKGPIPNYFCQALQGIRVSTSVKDIGTVALKQDDPYAARQKTSTEEE